MAVGVMALVALCAQLAAQAPLDTARRQLDDIALAHIKRELEKPAPALNLTLPKTDYYVFVDAIRPFADIFEQPPWVTPPQEHEAPRIAGSGRVAQFGGGGAAGGGIDPGVIGHAISKAVRTRKAHAEVVSAIIEYCAAHRDEPGAAGICGGPPR
jgi:hypothetical protein